MRQFSSICAVDPQFCRHGLTTTWRPRPGKAVHLAYIQIVVVCTLESRIPCHQTRQPTLAPLTLPQEHKTETRNRISQGPERMLARPPALAYALSAAQILQLRRRCCCSLRLWSCRGISNWTKDSFIWSCTSRGRKKKIHGGNAENRTHAFMQTTTHISSCVAVITTRRLIDCSRHEAVQAM